MFNPRTCAVFALLIAATLLVAPAAEARVPRPAPRLPVVVELFTAQGCSDCPKANDLLGKLAEEKGVLALTYSVDYWDYLGWKDTFAKPEFTDRQQAYATDLRLRDVYTPQIVLDGAPRSPAAKPDDGRGRGGGARREAALPLEMPCAATTGCSSARARPAGGAVVWLVRYDPGVSEVGVKTGDNKGLTVARPTRCATSSSSASGAARRSCCACPSRRAGPRRGGAGPGDPRRPNSKRSPATAITSWPSRTYPASTPPAPGKQTTATTTTTSSPFTSDASARCAPAEAGTKPWPSLAAPSPLPRARCASAKASGRGHATPATRPAPRRVTRARRRTRRRRRGRSRLRGYR